ncbi:MAG TPA: hypothetical protein VEL03_09685 [Streptosporangiaceae bacterium]|nr:hypothetical protein [Streptosporangiaceae bacterium]
MPLTAGDTASAMVAAAVWAPSVHNTQPWWFVAEGSELSLYADCGRQLAVADPAGREMLISCGAALFTARLAARSLGWIPRTALLPDRDDPLLVARVSWEERAAPAAFETTLFGQVRQRRTHRGGFDPLPLAPQLLTVLQAGAARDHAQLRVVTDESSRAWLASSVRAADEAIRLDSRRAREQAMWTSPPGSPRPDGVPACSYPARSVHTVPDFPSRDFARGRGWGLAPASTDAMAYSAGVVCLLTTVGDEPIDWVNAGQALQRILLTSAAVGVAAALHSQPLEFSRTRELIRGHTADGSYPQLIIRLGTVIQSAGSVRRSPGSMLAARLAPRSPSQV